MPRPGQSLIALLDDEQPDEAPTVARHLGPQQRLRAQESADARQAGAAQHAEERALVAQYGTTDVDKIKALTATGALDPNFKARAQLDPEWAKNAVQRAYELSGLAPGAQDAGDVGAGTPPPRQFRAGTGAHGEAYFTNLNDSELGMEGQSHGGPQTLGNDSAAPAQVHGLQPLEPGGGGGGTFSTIKRGGSDEGGGAELLFKQKLEEARQIAGAPEKALEHFSQVESEAQKLLDEHDDIASARETLHGRLMDGTYGKKGFTAKEVSGMDKLLIHRAKDPAEDPTADWGYWKPWHAPGTGMWKPGKSSDPAMPATILNPGGARTGAESAGQQKVMAASDQTAAIDESSPSELPRTFSYATQSPTAMRMRLDAARSRGQRAKAPANPLMGRLESDRKREMDDSRKELLGLNLTPDF